MAIKKSKAVAEPAAAQAQLAVANVEPAANDEARASILVINTQLAEFDKVEAGIADLEKTYKDVAFAVATTDGMDQAKAARKAIQTPRFALEAARVAAKRPIIDIGKQVDGRAGVIKARLMAIETPIDQQITAQETIEAERRAEIVRRLDEIRRTPDLAIGKSIQELEQIKEGLETLDLATFGEFREQAAKAQLEVTNKVATLLSQAKEAEAARQKLADQQAAQARIDAIRARIKTISDIATTAGMARTSASVQKLIDQAKAIVIDDSYAEFKNEAAGARLLVLEQLNIVFEAKQKTEAAAATPAPTPAPTVAPTPAPTPVPTPAAVHRSGGSVHAPMYAAYGAPAGLRPLASAPAPSIPEQSFTDVTATPDSAARVGVAPERPSDAEILAVLADHYDEDPATVAGWLRAFDAAAALAQQALSI